MDIIYLKRNKTEMILFEQESLLDGCDSVISPFSLFTATLLQGTLVGC